ncbi:ATP-binding protein [Mucilaginibacter robiniae]|uniref:ATP-binding protein n=1 Tax=Mucilaginibacter robiniae TaxID=2728022 RepID=A0A7L5E5E2_9SPHI|nr:NACHT domain-containing protein [Mucilaginibacter robiniae]QJD96984.1 ATP-binding protein [Mucilaginibacter robiniae]
MRTILQHELELLKKTILATANITVITPAVFKDLSIEVSKATKKQVSSSTLKRIFGFAAYNFQPSLYTLNVLAEYCGYESWNAFALKNSHTPTHNSVTPYMAESNLQNKAHEISLRTLHALKNKSGIPFSLTITRDILDEHLEIFTSTDYAATVLTAPAGYGKTIALCHWVEEQLNYYKQYDNQDILLFLSSKTLNRSNQQDDLYQWLLSLSGLTTEPAFAEEALRKHLQQHRFYLVIDALDSTSLPPEQLDIVLNMLLDMISIYQDTRNFKVILTMRSSNWANLYKQLTLENKINQWFLGFTVDDNDEKNFPLFTPHEIQLLSNKIKPGSNLTYELHDEVFALFSYPPFFQYYYQKNKTFLLSDLDIFGTYDVIYNYILDKVYTGRHCTEKVLLMHALVEKGRIKNGGFCIDKLKLYDDIKTFNNAYQDLLSISIIRESNFSNQAGYTECIEFVHERILTYCIAAKLVYDSNYAFDEKLINRINCTYSDNLRILVLKWLVFISLKNKQTAIFDYLPRIQLVAAEKAKLIVFLSKLIEQGFLSQEGGTDDLLFDITRPDLFNYFFGIEFISAEYEQALKGLLKLQLQDTSKIWLHTCLTIIYLVSLNTVGAEDHIAALRKFPAEAFLNFQINPLNCLETIYYYLKFNVIKKDALTDITRFIFHPITKRRQLNKLSSNHVLYILALSTLTIAGNHKKLLRFVKVLHHIHHTNDEFLPEFHFFLLLTKAHASLSMGNIQDAVTIFKLVIADYQDNKQNFTPYMKAYLDLLAARLVPYTSNHSYIEATIKQTVDAAENSTNKLLQVNTLSYYLKTNNSDRFSPEYRILYFKFVKLMRSTGFNPKCFVFNYYQIHSKNDNDNLFTIFGPK